MRKLRWARGLPHGYSTVTDPVGASGTIPNGIGMAKFLATTVEKVECTNRRQAPTSSGGGQVGVFDRRKEREHLRANYGIPMMLRRSLKESRSEAVVGNWAHACLKVAVVAALCEIDDAYFDLLARADDWMTISIEESEVHPPSYGPNITEALRFQALAIVRWLRSRELDQRLLAAACNELDQYFARQKDKTNVAYRLPTFVLARKWAELKSHFDAFPKWQKPTAKRGIKCPGKMCYLIAEHETLGDPDHGALARSFESFMAYQMPVCLMVNPQGLGIMEDVPTWMLLDEIYGSGDRADGPACIRKALRFVTVQD